MKSITVKELAQLITDKGDFQLIDVREEEEHRAFNIGGSLFPLGSITQHLAGIEKVKPVIFYCRKGIRSQLAIQKLQDKYPFTNLINLIGGTEAWKRENGV